jgi:serine/threonine-protein kinase
MDSRSSASDPNAPTVRLGVTAESSPGTSSEETLILGADTPTIIVDAQVAAIEAWSRPATIVAASHEATVIQQGPTSAQGDAPASRVRGADAASSAVRYVVMGMAGRGGMGTVHVARDVALQRRVALKELSHEVARDRFARARFVREVQVTAQLDHPHIVPVYGLEVADGGRPAYAMKLVEGRTFSQLIAQARSAHESGLVDEEHSLPTRLEHFLKVCDAVEYAHARGVVHRDLKPANLMVGRHKEVYVMDWGICRLLTQTEDEPRDGAPAVTLDTDGQTAFGTVVGTPLYMSPEQAQGRHGDLDARSDQCALGLILFELVTFRRPFAGRTVTEILQQAESGAREPVRHAFGQEIPRELIAIVERATARDPAARYADVGAFAQDVRRFLRGEAVEARPDTVWQQLLRRLARHRQSVAVAVLGFAVISLSVIVGLVWRSDRALKAQQFRERRIQAFTNQVSQQGDRLQTRLLDLRGELDALTMLASYAVEFGQANPTPVRWLDEHPATARQSGDEHGGFVLLPGASRPDAEALAHHLRDLETNQREVLELARRTLGGPKDVRVGTPEAAVQQLLAAFNGGLLYVFPGPEGPQRSADPREAPWYRNATTRSDVQWEAIDATESHAGRELVVSEGVRTTTGRVDGAVALVLSLDHTLTNLLSEGEIPGVRGTLLLDRDGFVLATHRPTAASSSGSASEAFVRDLPLSEIQHAADARANDVGFVETSRFGALHVIAVDRIHPLDWLLLSIVDEGMLLR